MRRFRFPLNVEALLYVTSVLFATAAFIVPKFLYDILEFTFPVLICMVHAWATAASSICYFKLCGGTPTLPPVKQAALLCVVYLAALWSVYHSLMFNSFVSFLVYASLLIPTGAWRHFRSFGETPPSMLVLIHVFMLLSVLASAATDLELTWRGFGYGVASSLLCALHQHLFERCVDASPGQLSTHAACHEKDRSGEGRTPNGAEAKVDFSTVHGSEEHRHASASHDAIASLVMLQSSAAAVASCALFLALEERGEIDFCNTLFMLYLALSAALSALAITAAQLTRWVAGSVGVQVGNRWPAACDTERITSTASLLTKRTLSHPAALCAACSIPFPTIVVSPIWWLGIFDLLRVALLVFCGYMFFCVSLESENFLFNFVLFFSAVVHWIIFTKSPWGSRSRSRAPSFQVSAERPSSDSEFSV